jgi:polyisoprenoid-binding protein YceI
VDPGKTAVEPRKRPALRLLALCVVALAGATVVDAASPPPVVLELDPAATEIRFTLQASLHTVEGRFALKRGEIRFDPATGTAAGEIVVDAASGQSGNRMRDAAMRDDVLEAEHYPEIRFRPERIEGDFRSADDVHARVQGTMELHGSLHAMTLDVTARRVKDQVTLTTRFAVPYVAWGLEDPSLLFLRVSHEVAIDVTASARLRTADAATADPAPGPRAER